MYTVVSGEPYMKYVKHYAEIQIASKACPACSVLLPQHWLQRAKPPLPVLCTHREQLCSSEEGWESFNHSDVFRLLPKGLEYRWALWTLVSALLSVVSHSSAALEHSAGSTKLMGLIPIRAFT